MPVIKTIDRSVCQFLRTEMEHDLAMLKNKYGLDIKVGKATYSDENVTFKVEFAVQNPDGNSMTREAKAYQVNAPYLGMKAEWLFKEFSFRGDRMQIVGLKPKSIKYPLLVKNLSDGKTYKMHPDSIKHLLQML